MKHLMQLLADENALLSANALQAVKGGTNPPILPEEPPVEDDDPWWKFW